ncbi:MAG: hypothetical protein CVT80_17170 [Alphaproteobacteria bacterium HGW-Alphaproteobacteria-2]|nr:MAG: hypothetical protein CVT80_17170 [Alphaproteobacteria bacterium HGW-Alphaproteobacteria-2]
MGAIQDRTKEHLGRTDVGIVRYRRMLRAAMDALEAGNPQALPMQGGGAGALRGPMAIDAIGPGQAWERLWAEADAARRAGAPWSAGL